MLKTRLFDSGLNNKDLFGVEEILRSGQLNAGALTTDLESRLSGLYDRHSCLCLSDMTTAITQLLQHLNVKPGDSVLCHPFSCLSTTMAVKLVGANVEWITFDFNKMSIDIDALEEHQTNSKVLINYNVAGYLPDLLALEKICKRKGITLINDCNNAEISQFLGKFAAQYGDYAILSFYPNRWFGAIDGGAILSNKSMEGLYEKKRLGVDLKNYRNNFGAFNPSHDVTSAAGANNMHNISAQIVLNKLDYWAEIRSSATNIYNSLYETFEDYTIKRVDGFAVIPWLFPLLVEKPTKMIELLYEFGLEATELHFLNNRYSIFAPSESSQDSGRVVWLPMNANSLKIKKEILENVE